MRYRLTLFSSDSGQPFWMSLYPSPSRIMIASLFAGYLLRQLGWSWSEERGTLKALKWSLDKIFGDSHSPSIFIISPFLLVQVLFFRRTFRWRRLRFRCGSRVSGVLTAVVVFSRLVGSIEIWNHQGSAERGQRGDVTSRICGVQYVSIIFWCLSRSSPEMMINDQLKAIGTKDGEDLWIQGGRHPSQLQGGLNRWNRSCWKPFCHWKTTQSRFPQCYISIYHYILLHIYISIHLWLWIVGISWNVNIDADLASAFEWPVLMYVTGASPPEKISDGHSPVMTCLLSACEEPKHVFMSTQIISPDGMCVHRLRIQ